MKKSAFKKIKGGVAAPLGFVAGSIYVGIKRANKDRPDMAMICSQTPCVGAGVFTTNKVQAAPVKVSQTHGKSADIRAIIANSGNANACTGPEGLENAKRMTRAVAENLGLQEKQVLVCSTGRIGVPLPIEKMEGKIPLLAKSLSRSGSRKAALAIMTSDTFPKEIAIEVTLASGTVRIGGIAKGAGMIDPNMATMLSFLTTDARISKTLLRKALRVAVAQSFNRITIDGDMSTNDTVLFLANGAAGGVELKADSKDFQMFQRAVIFVTQQLARLIVEDGEGVSKFVEILVRGAASEADARKAAEAIANSTLTKCAWSGNDPNWGRIMNAVGYSGARIDADNIDVFYNDTLAVTRGMPVGVPPEHLKKIVSKKEFQVTVNLHMGRAEYTVWTTDLTTEYVVLNQSE